MNYNKNSSTIYLFTSNLHLKPNHFLYFLVEHKKFFLSYVQKRDFKNDLVQSRIKCDNDNTDN